jgi:REP element-mobilizing transposase RayT
VNPDPSDVILSAITRLRADGDIRLICAVVMPDHVHVFLVLGTRLTISQVVGKFKSLTTCSLRHSETDWQENFFEHRLRPDDREDGFVRYVFLNPYKANLIERQQVWPQWVMGEDVEPGFQSMLDEGKYPPAEWLEAPLEAFGLQDSHVGRD